MRLIIVCLTALLLLIQYPLWLGKGGWLSVRKLDGQVQLARKKNDELRARNAKLESEVHDLQQGTGAIEERARYELGMIRQNEIFIQVLDANGAPAASATTGVAATAPAVPATVSTAASTSTSTTASATTASAPSSTQNR
jgi:cell division protein FtsB